MLNFDGAFFYETDDDVGADGCYRFVCQRGGIR